MRYPIEPVPKPRMTQRDLWKKRPCVLRYYRFKDQCRVRRVKLPQPCRVVFHMPMPSGWSNERQRAMDGMPHTVRPDLDNLVKALGDAVCKEDSHLWNIRAEKRWSLTPGIEVVKVREGT